MNHEGILRTVVRTKRGHSQVTLRDTRVIALTDWQTSKLSGMVTFYQFSHTILLLMQVTLHIRSPGYSWAQTGLSPCVLEIWDTCSLTLMCNSCLVRGFNPISFIKKTRRNFKCANQTKVKRAKF